MTLEVEMPHPDMAGMKQKGRVYVCDLAGTEPAGDIVFAKYEKKVFPNGDIEHKFIGAHEDDRKTKELQVCSRVEANVSAVNVSIERLNLTTSGLKAT